MVVITIKMSFERRFVTIMSLTLRPDRLRDRAGVAQAIRVDRSDNKKINGVGKESDHRMSLMPHVVRHRLPGAAHGLAEEGKNSETLSSKIW